MRQFVTIITPDIADECAEIKANHKEYAAAHDYTFQCYEDLHWPDLPASFSKIWCLQQALHDERNDVVLWVDADVAFIDMTFDLAELLKPDYWLAAYDQQNKQWIGERPYICAGLMAIRNSESTRAFFDEVARRVETRENTVHPWEQWYMDQMMMATKFAGVHLCKAHEIGAFSRELWNDGVPWHPGCPTVHISCTGDWPRRRQIFLDYYLPIVKRK